MRPWSSFTACGDVEQKDADNPKAGTKCFALAPLSALPFSWFLTFGKVKGVQNKATFVQTHRGRETDISLAAEPFHVVMMQEAQDHVDRPTTADSSS